MISMKNFLLSTALLTFSAMASVSCASKTLSVSPPPQVAQAPVAPPAVPVPGPVEPLVVTRENITFTLPGGGVFHEIDMKENASVKALFANEATKSLVLMAKAKFGGPPEVFPLLLLKSAESAGGTIDGVKQVNVNGNDMVLFLSHKEDTSVLNLVMAKDGFGYDLACGGPTDAKDVGSVCGEILHSLTIK